MENREIKFRAWDGGKMIYPTYALAKISRFFRVIREDAILMQYTGLKDKNAASELYDGDILSKDGIIIGNKYENSELLKDGANILIEGFGTKNWRDAEKEAMGRGCFYSE